MRRANGTGTIIKLGGARRKPYAVRVACRDKFGRVAQKTVSYHEKQKDAQAALDEYNRSRKRGLSPAPDKLAITVQQVYDMWSARKYAKAGGASIASYKASWSRLQQIAPLKMREVTLTHLQGIIDNDEAGGLSKSSTNNDKTLMRALFKFAMERDIITKDYSAFVEMPSIGAKIEKGAFDDLQMQKLEQLAADGFPWADTVLMLCYTGFRITEFLTLTRFSYDAEGDYLTGGIKTAAGKNRTVPVHPKIKPYLLAWIDKSGDAIICSEKGKPVADQKYRDKLFKPVMNAIGCPQATPHWCRHTFASRLHAAGAEELAKKRLLGHSDRDVTEHYTHTDIEQLKAAIQLLA